MKRGTHFGGPLSFAQGGLSLPDGTELRTAKIRVQAAGGTIASPAADFSSAPGAGKAILVLGGTARYKHAGTATTAVGSFRIRTGSATSYLSLALSNFDALTADKIIPLDLSTGGVGALVENQPLHLTTSGVPVGSITVSDNAAYLEIVLMYAIVKVS